MGNVLLKNVVGLHMIFIMKFQMLFYCIDSMHTTEHNCTMETSVYITFIIIIIIIIHEWRRTKINGCPFLEQLSKPQHAIKKL